MTVSWHDLTGFQRDALKAVLRLSQHKDAVSGQMILRHLEAEFEKVDSFEEVSF